MGLRPTLATTRSPAMRHQDHLVPVVETTRIQVMRRPALPAECQALHDLPLGLCLLAHSNPIRVRCADRNAVVVADLVAPVVPEVDRVVPAVDPEDPAADRVVTVAAPVAAGAAVLLVLPVVLVQVANQVLLVAVGVPVVRVVVAVLVASRRNRGSRSGPSARNSTIWKRRRLAVSGFLPERVARYGFLEVLR